MKLWRYGHRRIWKNTIFGPDYYDSVGSQLQKQFDFFEQASATAASDYKFHTKIEILDGGNGDKDPVVLDRFELKGCYIESANYNTLAYATSDAVTVSLTIRYDNAIQKGVNGGAISGIGQPTAR